jgi:diguanylate cyclase (GGDEF)-like protein
VEKILTINKTSIKQKVFSELVKILHNNLLASVPANFICATVIAISLYQSGSYVWTWYASIFFVSVFRMLSLYLYRYHYRQDNFHLAIFMIGMTLSAILWGMIASLLMPANAPMEQLIIIVVVAGVTAGGIQTLNANLLACMIYLCTIILPLCGWLILQTNFAYVLLNLAIMAYFAFMVVTSIRGNRLLTRALTLQYENLALIEKLSVSNTKLLNAYKTQEKHEHKIIVINKMNDMLQACQEVKEAFAVIQITAKELFTELSGGLFILNPGNNELEIAAHWGDENTLQAGFSASACWALRKGREYHLNHPAANLNCHHFSSPPHASVCLPLSIQTQGMGLLVFYSMQEQALTSEQLQLANTFSEVIQLSLTNIKLRETLYEQSIQDPLTGLYNRRYLDETLARDLQRAKREHKPLCVAMLDLDNFKEFNDHYGHDAGDEVLKYVSTILLNHFRGTDMSCRYGGEEFLLVMINMNMSSSLLKLEQIKNIIKNGEIHFRENILPPITVSIGVAEAPRQGMTVREIIHAADMALYSAKQAGKDRIVCSNAGDLINQ